MSGSQGQSKLVRAAIGVVRRGDLFLVVKRAAHIRAPNQLCFPGGGIEPGESVDTAVVRELNEELNVDVRPIREIWRSRSAWGVDMHWVACHLADDAAIVPNPDEVAEFYWLAQAQVVSAQHLLSSNRDFFEALDRGEFGLHD